MYANNIPWANGKALGTESFIGCNGSTLGQAQAYTFDFFAALTRAKSLIVVIGPERAIDKAVKEAEGDKRLSTLKDRIQVSHRSRGQLPRRPLI